MIKNTFEIQAEVAILQIQYFFRQRLLKTSQTKPLKDIIALWNLFQSYNKRTVVKPEEE